MKTTIGRWIFLILSLIAPLLYLSMYFPIWNGKERAFANADIFSAVLIIFQCLCLLLALLRLCFVKLRNIDSCLLTCALDFVAVISITLTCFTGFFFVLELFNVPWFPAQR